MAQLAKSPAKKVNQEKLSEILDSAIAKNSYVVILSLIENSKKLGIDQEKTKEKISALLLSYVKEDFASETYEYIENSYSIAGMLKKDGHLGAASVRFENSTRHDLTRYLKELKQRTSQPEKKGEVGTKFGSTISEGNFTAKFKAAKRAELILPSDEFYLTNQASKICADLIGRGKLEEFMEFASLLVEDKVLSSKELLDKFKSSAMAAMEKGSERVLLDFKGLSIVKKKLYLDLNTYAIERNLYGLMELGLLERSDAIRIASSFEQKGLAENVTVAKIKAEKKVSDLTDAINGGNFEDVVKHSKLFRR